MTVLLTRGQGNTLYRNRIVELGGLTAALTAAAVNGHFVRSALEPNWTALPCQKAFIMMIGGFGQDDHSPLIKKKSF
jgi:hypothetical protein